MNLLVGALTGGLLYALLTLGVFVSFRVLNRLDLTTDGAFGLGAAVGAVLLRQGIHPVTATLVGALAGALAGATTGLIHTVLRIDTLIAGILVTTALYSVQLYIMGGGSLSLATADSIPQLADRIWHRLGGPPSVTLFDTTVAAENVAALLLFLLLVVASAVLLERFLRSDLGMAVRATGDNGQMARALGIDVSFMLILGLTLANGFVALAGTLFVQNQGSTDLQTPVGMIVVALACLVLGETFTDREKLSRTIAGVASGAVLLRLLVAAAIRAGLDPNALKLITAAFALLALVLPSTIRRAFRRAAGGEPDD